MMPSNKAIVVAINNEDILEFPDYATAKRWINDYYGQTLCRKYTCRECSSSVLLTPIQYEEMKPEDTNFLPSLGPCGPSESWEKVTTRHGFPHDGWLCNACYSRLLKALI